jgi:hypothetical protein
MYWGGFRALGRMRPTWTPSAWRRRCDIGKLPSRQDSMQAGQADARRNGVMRATAGAQSWPTPESLCSAWRTRLRLPPRVLMEPAIRKGCTHRPEAARMVAIVDAYDATRPRLSCRGKVEAARIEQDAARSSIVPGRVFLACCRMRIHRTIPTAVPPCGRLGQAFPAWGPEPGACCRAKQEIQIKNISRRGAEAAEKSK